MRLEHYPVEKLKSEILEIIGKYLDLRRYKVFFFGSRVEGKGSERSDIDIGIQGPKEVPLEIFYRIKEELDEKIPVLYKFDLVDFNSCDEGFKEIALRKIEKIN